jgi:hypothetical protein
MGADFEIHRSHTESNASPVVGASADDAGAEPAEVRAGSGDVGFAFNLPCAVGSAEFVFDSLTSAATDSGATMREVVGPDVLFEVSLGNQRRAGFEQRNT